MFGWSNDVSIRTSSLILCILDLANFALLNTLIATLNDGSIRFSLRNTFPNAPHPKTLLLYVRV
jgi:hypothetical protein